MVWVLKHMTRAWGGGAWLVLVGMVRWVLSPLGRAMWGRGAARRYFATGERFGADVALRIGLVHEVSDDADEAVGLILEELGSAGPEAARHAKRLVLERPEGLATERRIAERRTSVVGLAGRRAFLDTRTPDGAD